MADTKISDLSALTGENLAPGDLLTAVDVSDTSMAATGTNKKMEADELAVGLDAQPRAINSLTTTTNYTLKATDAGKIVELSTNSASQIIIPTNANVAMSVGTQIDIVQTGAGAITVTTQSGVTILKNGNVGLVLSTVYAVVSIYKRATDSWVLTGDLA